MLYDPKWEQQTKADPLTLEALVAWLEKQPADKVYCYTSTGECLAAKYNRSIGRKYEVVALLGGDPETFDYKLEDIAIGEPRTFGAALKRAKNLAV